MFSNQKICKYLLKKIHQDNNQHYDFTVFPFISSPFFSFVPNLSSSSTNIFLFLILSSQISSDVYFCEISQLLLRKWFEPKLY